MGVMIGVGATKTGWLRMRLWGGVELLLSLAKQVETVEDDEDGLRRDGVVKRGVNVAAVADIDRQHDRSGWYDHSSEFCFGFYTKSPHSFFFWFLHGLSDRLGLGVPHASTCYPTMHFLFSHTYIRIHHHHPCIFIP